MIAIMSVRFTLADHGAARRPLARDEALFRRGDPVTTMFEVTEGGVRLERHGPDGRPAILGRAGPGDLVAEASLFAETYGCDAVAEEEGAVLVASRDALHRRLEGDPTALMALLERTAREVHALRGRAEILSLPRVADRLDAWLARGAERRGPWHAVAREIGVSPEALYRELARRRAAGPDERAGSADRRALTPWPCPTAR